VTRPTPRSRAAPRLRHLRALRSRGAAPRGSLARRPLGARRTARRGGVSRARAALPGRDRGRPEDRLLLRSARQSRLGRPLGGAAQPARPVRAHRGVLAARAARRRAAGGGGGVRAALAGAGAPAARAQRSARPRPRSSSRATSSKTCERAASASTSSSAIRRRWRGAAPTSSARHALTRTSTGSPSVASRPADTSSPSVAAARSTASSSGRSSTPPLSKRARGRSCWRRSRPRPITRWRWPTPRASTSRDGCCALWRDAEPEDSDALRGTSRARALRLGRAILGRPARLAAGRRMPAIGPEPAGRIRAPGGRS
jgi:hypothetical protein